MVQGRYLQVQDDLHVSIVLESGHYSKKQSTTNWQGEFDKNGMTRATRVPLGHAAKIWKNVGDVDIETISSALTLLRTTHGARGDRELPTDSLSGTMVYLSRSK